MNTYPFIHNTCDLIVSGIIYLISLSDSFLKEPTVPSSTPDRVLPNLDPPALALKLVILVSFCMSLEPFVLLPLC